MIDYEFKLKKLINRDTAQNVKNIIWSIKKNIIFPANLRTRVPLSVLQESADQQMGRTPDHVRISTVSNLQGEYRGCNIIIYYYRHHSFELLIFVLLLQTQIEHACLAEVLDPIRELMADVKRKALMRLEYEGDCTMKSNHAAVYAMEKYAYYVCFKCTKVSWPHRQSSVLADIFI